MAEGRQALRAWILMDELVIDVYTMTRKPPVECPADLAAALRSVALQAALRIVQGLHGPAADLAPSLRSAQGVLAELRYHLYLSRRVGLIELRRYRTACARHERVQKCLRDLLSNGQTAPAAKASAITRAAGTPGPLEEGFAVLDGGPLDAVGNG